MHQKSIAQSLPVRGEYPLSPTPVALTFLRALPVGYPIGGRYCPPVCPEGTPQGGSKGQPKGYLPPMGYCPLRAGQGYRGRGQDRRNYGPNPYPRLPIGARRVS
uniref:Uncharacterized protein n=1 Tax=Udotea flabellum TaxID=170437 RepID=A0A386B202_9CHLO|nr:hypothetical protein [Udotea flabellum]AYC65687.1 hypothetical protein [Udotea flabellum]